MAPREGPKISKSSLINECGKALQGMMLSCNCKAQSQGFPVTRTIFCVSFVSLAEG